MKKSRIISSVFKPAGSDSFYAAVSGELLSEQSTPIRTAWLIEKLASERGWPVGELLGSESELRNRLGVGREALREAISVLSNRGVIEVPPSSLRAEQDPSRAEARVRAFAIAQMLLERAAARGETGLGNELSLCDEFSSSRSVIRQALRILQDLDVVQARLGRSGGYEIKRPRPIGVIRQVGAWMAACRLCPFALVELVWDLNAASVRLATACLHALPEEERERHLRGLYILLDEENDAHRFVSFQKRLAEIAESPLVDVLARSAVSYQALQQREKESGSPPLSFLHEEREAIHALREGNPDAAEASIRAMQTRLQKVLQEAMVQH